MAVDASKKPRQTCGDRVTYKYGYELFKLGFMFTVIVNANRD